MTNVRGMFITDPRPPRDRRRSNMYPHLMYIFYNKRNNNGTYFNSSSRGNRLAFVTTPTIYFSNNALSSFVNPIRNRHNLTENILLTPREKNTILGRLKTLTKGSSDNLKLNRAAAVVRNTLRARLAKSNHIRRQGGNTSVGHNNAIKYFRVLNKALNGRTPITILHNASMNTIRHNSRLTQKIKNLAKKLNVRTNDPVRNEFLRGERASITQNVMNLVGTGGRVKGYGQLMRNRAAAAERARARENAARARANREARAKAEANATARAAAKAKENENRKAKAAVEAAKKAVETLANLERQGAKRFNKRNTNNVGNQYTVTPKGKAKPTTSSKK